VSLGQSVRRGTSWLMFGNTGDMVLQFLIGIILARLLTPADFGMVVSVQIFTGFMGMLLSGGMGQSLIRAKHVGEEDFNTVFTIQMSMGALIFLGFSVAAPWIAAYLEDPRYADLLRVSAFSFVLRPVALVRTAWLNRAMLFKKRAMVMLASSVVTGLSSIAMAVAGLGVWSLILSGILGALATNILLWFAIPLRVRFGFDEEAAQRHSSFGLKVTTNDFLSYLRDQSVNLILTKMAGPASVGLFNKGESLARLPNRVITPPTGQAVFRALSKVQDNLDQTKYMFYRTITLLMAYIAPALVTMWWVAEPLIEVLYGHQWIAAAEPMKILIMAALFRPIRTPSGVVLAAQNRLGRETVALAISLFITVAASLIGVRWGLAGVAWAVLGSGVFLSAYQYSLVYRILPTRLGDLALAVMPGMILSLLVGITLAALHYGLIAPLVSRAPLAYLLLMGGTGAVVFLLGLLFLPLAQLRTESDRWRTAIRQAWRVATGESA